MLSQIQTGMQSHWSVHPRHPRPSVLETARVVHRVGGQLGKCGAVEFAVGVGAEAVDHDIDWWMLSCCEVNAI